MLVARRRRRAPRARLRPSGRASGRRVKSDATARRPFVSTSRADSDDETRVARRRPRSPSALVQSRWGRDDDVGCGRKARVKVILQKSETRKIARPPLRQVFGTRDAGEEGVVKFHRRRRGGSLRDAVSGVQGRRAVLVRVGQGSEEDQGDAARVRPVLLRRLNGGASQRVGI